MARESPPDGGLGVLAQAFRAKRTGVLTVGPESARIGARLESGQVVALGPASGGDAAPLPKPNDSVRLRLDRILAEVGMRPPRRPAAAPRPLEEPGSLRDRLIEQLADLAAPATFADGTAATPELVVVSLSTESLILETVRRVRHDEAVRNAIGDLDRRLVATTALADERTLTLTEGYLLSRIDGLVSARDVLSLVPLDPVEAERTLLGLLLTGRVQSVPAPHPRAEAAPAAHATPAPEADPGPVAPLETVPASEIEGPIPGEADGEPLSEDIVAEADDSDPTPTVEPIADDEPGGDAVTPEAARPPMPTQAARPVLDPATIERRREILEFFQGLPLKNHFEVLGVEPGCADGDVRRAYVSLAKRFHPDANRDARLEDMNDIMEAIFIRVGEAWEVLGEARSRASYESRSGIVRRSSSVPTSSQASGPVPGSPPASAEAQQPSDYVPPEEVLHRARRMLAQARYWDAIQMLETALPAMEPRSQQHRGRLLLARAYSKNPNWLRRAEEMLQELMREDPTSADVHYELGLVYKSGGFVARAQGMFKRAVELKPGHKEASAELGIAPEAESPSPGLLKRLFKRGKAS